jgi:hypothetical protein
MDIFKKSLTGFISHYMTLNDVVIIERYHLNELSLYTVGEITFPTETLTFNVFVGEHDSLPPSSILTPIDDNNSFDIVIHQDVIKSLSDDEYARLNVRMYIVRIISKLMLMITDHSPLVDINYPLITTYEPELHKFFLNQYIETNNTLFHQQYRNLILKSILSQSYLTNEYAIDLEALKTIQDPIVYSTILLKSISHLDNPLAVLEMVTRTNKLVTENIPFPKPTYTIMM